MLNRISGARAVLNDVPSRAVGRLLIFLLLCLVNSALSAMPAVAPLYEPVKAALGHVSTWGLLIAIGALGLGTSLSAIAALGWRHVATVTATTVVILAVVIAGLLVTG